MANHSTLLAHATLIDLIDLNKICVTFAYLTFFTNINTTITIFYMLL